MRKKILHKAKFIVKVESIKPSSDKLWVSDSPRLKIKTISVLDNRTNMFWTENQIKERGIEFFLDTSDLKESLNWNLNGDSSKYQFKWLQSGKEITEGVAYIFD